jgi:phenylalanyl-tRNA synthetase beta chain
MRVPLSWLRDYVDVQLTPEQLAERLTLLGMEVQGLEQWGADWRKVVVGELLTVEKHPHADRLRLTTVNVGSGEPLRIVCGANNIAPGQRVPVALPGAILPGERRIERTEKMGIASEGMLCSGDELHITSDAEGILILPADTRLGVQLSDLYGDAVLDVDVKPNRGDALCLIGLAREVAAATGAAVRWPKIELEEKGEPVSERLTVEVREPGLCTRFVGRWVSGVKIGPSPDWAQMRLQAAGMRPVSNVVDASNYVMLELGKPTHTFDGAAVHDGTIIVRRANPGERLETLDHVVRELTPDTLIIADPKGPIGIAGVMGGADSEISDATTEIAIESAVFDSVSIRRTGHRYALRSEASLRFEKGQEPRLARIGADRVAQLTLAWAGGKACRGRVDTAPSEPIEGRLAFRPARVSRLLGAAVPTAEQRELLRRVGVETEDAGPGTVIQVAVEPRPLAVHSAEETVVAIVPTWRRDLVIEADVTEEVARVRGYETTPAHLPDTVMPAFRPSPDKARDLIRETLAGAGLSEVVTHALVSPLDEARLIWPDDGSEPAFPPNLAAPAGDQIAVTNPLSAQHSVLRRHLPASLLEVLSVNERQGRPDVRIFEIGKGYARVSDGPREWVRLGLLLSGAAEPASWNRAVRSCDLDDAKGLLELLARRLGISGLSCVPDRRGFPLHPGRALLVRDSSSEAFLAGRVAEMHPEALALWDLRAPRVIIAELALASLDGAAPRAVHVEPIPRFPEVERDLAIIVSEDRTAAEVEATIGGHGGPLLRGVRLFDLYRGAPLAATEKSLAYRLLFGARDRTLTEAEIDAAIDAIRAGLASDLGARIRS